VKPCTYAELAAVFAALVCTLAAAEERTLEAPAHVSCLLTPARGDRIVAVGGDSGNHGFIRVWNTRDWSVSARLDLSFSIRDACLLPGSDRLAVCGRRNSQGKELMVIGIWDVVECRCVVLRELLGDHVPISARNAETLAIAPGEEVMRDCGVSPEDGRTTKLSLWDAQNLKHQRDVGQPFLPEEEFHVQFKPNTPCLAVGAGRIHREFNPNGPDRASWKSRTLMLDVDSGKTLWERPSDRAIHVFAFSPTDNMMCVGEGEMIGRGRLVHLRPASGELIESVDLDYDVWSLAYSPDGTMIAACGPIGSDPVRVQLDPHSTVSLWDAKTRKRLALRTFSGIAGGLTFTSDGSSLAVGATEKRILVWSVRDLLASPK
jgi:WD40 repeat protein